MSKNRGGASGKAPSNIEGIKNPKSTIAYIEGQLVRFEVELASMPTGSAEWCEQLARIDKKKSKLRLAFPQFRGVRDNEDDTNGRIDLPSVRGGG